MTDLASVIRPGDGLLWGPDCAEPQTLVEAVVAQRAAFPGATVFLGSSHSGIVKTQHADHLRFTSYFGTGSNRALAEAGLLEIYPAPYSQLGSLIEDKSIRCDVVLLQVSPPNSRGEYSLGLGVEYLAPALKVARAVVAEVNHQVPWTHTDPLLRRKDFALIVESSRSPVYLPYRTGELETAIAGNAAPFIPERAVLECGIGNLPNAVLCALQDRRGLRFHSGLVPDGVAELARKGAFTGEIHGAALMGTQALFDWARDNALLRLHSSDYTHGACVLGKLERFVAIHCAVEVDLTGQVNGEADGALDFIRAANQSPGGIALVCLPADRIVEQLQGPVATPRSEAGVIVTEKGAADLRGCTLRERERRLRAISGSS